MVIPNEVELRELAKSIAGPHWVPNADFGSLPYLWTGPPPSGETQQNVIFVLGGPGAGKGTQSELLMKEYPCRHLSVGELLRAERETNPTSPNAKLIEDCLVQGTIVPVEVSLNLVKQAMATSGKCCYYLVDGFPRNFDNLHGWLTHMPPQHIYGRAALVYQCQDFDILKERILTRGETSGRSDDNLASLQKRLDTLTRDTVPVVHFLNECANGGNGKFYLCQIAAEGTIAQVWTQTQSHINQIMRNDILTANARLMQAIESQNIPLYASLMDSNMFVDSDTTTTTTTSNDTDAAVPSAASVDLDAMKKMFDQHETDGAKDANGGLLPSIGVVTNAEFQLVTGTKANVSYDHTFSGTQVRETRVWSHFPERGWVCIHFFRTPLLP
jgi:UMP-CMP kinase